MDSRIRVIPIRVAMAESWPGSRFHLGSIRVSGRNVPRGGRRRAGGWPAGT